MYASWLYVHREHQLDQGSGSTHYAGSSDLWKQYRSARMMFLWSFKATIQLTPSHLPESRPVAGEFHGSREDQDNHGITMASTKALLRRNLLEFDCADTN